MVEVNYSAVLLCGIASMVLGTLWYGPLFGKTWMSLAGFKQEDMDRMKTDPKAKMTMYRSYALMFVSSLVMAYVLSHVITFSMAYLGESGVSAGIMGGIWTWLGFVATTTIGSVLWEMKPWKYWFIVGGYYLVQLVAMGLILSFWM